MTANEQQARRAILARERLRRVADCRPPDDAARATVEHEVQERSVLLVAGGTPAARAVLAALQSPEAQERFRQSFEEFGRQLGLLVADVMRAFERTLSAYRPALVDLHEQLVDAGVIRDPGPTDPRERALWLRQHRNTGPDRQVQHRPAPRKLR